MTQGTYRPGDRRNLYPNEHTGAAGRRRLPDLRLSSPAQLALIGAGLWLAAILLPSLGFLAFVGVGTLLVAGLSLFVRPRTREMYWRGRRIEIGGEAPLGERLYRLIYRG